MERTREEGGVVEWYEIKVPEETAQLEGQQYAFMGRSSEPGVFVRCIVGLEPAKKAPGDIWLPEEQLLLYHISISTPTRYPRWDEIADARYRFVPDHVTMAMLLPPEDRYLNLHPYVLHLWQIDDRRNDYVNGAEFAREYRRELAGQQTLEEVDT